MPPVTESTVASWANGKNLKFYFGAALWSFHGPSSWCILHILTWYDWSEAATQWAYPHIQFASSGSLGVKASIQRKASRWSLKRTYLAEPSCIQPKVLPNSRNVQHGLDGLCMFALMFAASQSIINCPVHACKLLNILAGWNAIGTPHSSAPTRGYPGSGASHQLLRSPPHALHLDYALRQRGIYCTQNRKGKWQYIA